MSLNDPGLRRAQLAYDGMEPPDSCPECMRRDYAREVAGAAEAKGLDYDSAWEQAFEEWDDWDGVFCSEHRGRRDDD